MPESDLDFAVLVKPVTTATVIGNIEIAWLNYSANQPTILKYIKSQINFLIFI